jgi:hypothetical protein
MRASDAQPFVIERAPPPPIVGTPKNFQSLFVGVIHHATIRDE